MYLSCEQRLKSLNLYTLFCRHHRGDLIEVYKILNGCYDSTKFFTLADAGTTKGHHMKLYKYHTRLKLMSDQTFLLKELLIVGIIYLKK